MGGLNYYLGLMVWAKANRIKPKYAIRKINEELEWMKKDYVIPDWLVLQPKEERYHPCNDRFYKVGQKRGV